MENQADPTVEGARAFREWLIKTTDYPTRGALAAFAERCGMDQSFGPQLGKYCRGMAIPTDDTLHIIAAGAGEPFSKLYDMLHPGMSRPAPELDEADLAAMGRAIAEANAIYNRLMSKQVASVVALSRRQPTEKRDRRRKQTNQASSITNPSNDDYGHHSGTTIEANLLRTITAHHSGVNTHRMTVPARELAASGAR